MANGTLSLSSTAIVTAIFQPSVYDVLIDVTPFNCGSVDVISGSAHNDYTNNTTIATPFGSYVVQAKPCSGFHLSIWVATGGVLLASNDSNTTTLTVGASGNLTAIYVPVSPVLRVAVPSSAYAGTTVTLTANVSTPVPPYTYTYDWNFGDGTNATTHDGFTTHTFALVGTYIVRVTVIDPYHRTSTVNATISVVSQSSTAINGIGLLRIHRHRDRGGGGRIGPPPRAAPFGLGPRGRGVRTDPQAYRVLPRTPRLPSHSSPTRDSRKNDPKQGTPHGECPVDERSNRPPGPPGGNPGLGSELGGSWRSW